MESGQPSSLSLAGRGAVVTGAGRGIGRAVARQLAQLGAGVVVNDVGTSLAGEGTDATVARQVAEEITAAGGRAVACEESVTDYEAAGRIVAMAHDHFGGADILVNNAGVSAPAPIWDIAPEVFERVHAVHMLGTFNCTRHAAPGMKERGWGRIVNLVSRAGLQGVPGTAAYAAGKGGIFGFTNAVSRDLAPHGVTVNAVNPAATDTRMVTEAVDAFRREGGEAARRAESLVASLQSPESVAALIAALCSEASGPVTGEVFFVRGEEIGIFEPLQTPRTISRPGGWDVEELLEAIPTLPLHPLDEPY